jgi:hypothetical protein
MRCLSLLAGSLTALFPLVTAAAQAADTMPVSVVERMFDAFNRDDAAARSALYDSVYYFQDLMVPRAGDPKRPAAMTAEERARSWQASSASLRAGNPAPRSRKVLERMVAGRFVVYHVAVVFDPPNEDQTFQKLEVYEVKNGKIVAEYDGQYVASGPLSGR